MVGSLGSFEWDVLEVDADSWFSRSFGDRTRVVL